jgi:hypothetical protein
MDPNQTNLSLTENELSQRAGHDNGNRVPAILFIIGLILYLCLFTGCANTTVAKTASWEVVNGPDYQVHNVHKLAPKLPDGLRRVAILPLSTEPSDTDMVTARETLEPVMQSEFDRLNVFEVIRVTRDQMRQMTGQAEWSASDKLPRNFLATLKEETGCDGVIFPRLTRYRPYPPMALGWSLKLIDLTDGQIWWAADEMFDLADPTVVNSARRYQITHLKFAKANPLLEDSTVVLISPTRLAQFTTASLFATLPER